ncbi:MAG: hypothetical protein Aurels2KO_05450 [Aureliella sp.]
MRALLLSVAAIAMLLCAVVELYRRIEDHVAGGYRVQAAGDLLVVYLDHSGEWPKDWGDLRRFVETDKSSLRYPPEVKELQRHVRIDFDFAVDAVELQRDRSDDEPPHVVVSSKYGRMHGATRNPNEFIFTYLQCDAHTRRELVGPLTTSKQSPHNARPAQSP